MMYKENPKLAKWVIGVLVFGLGAAVFGLVTAMQEDQMPMLLVLAVAAVMVWVVISLAKMRYEINEKEVKGVMWPFSISVQYDELAEVQVENMHWFLGVGFRIGPGFRVLSTRYGEGVRLRKKNGVDVYFTPNNPAQFVKLVKQEMKKRN